MRHRLALSLLCTLALAGCNGYFGSPGDDNGGGDGGGGSTSDAQGIWVGTTSDRFQYHMLVTPNNDVWGLSWDESANTVSRLTRGTGSLSGTAFNGTVKNFASGTGGTVGSATLTGTVQSASTFNGNLGQNITFTSNFNAQYNGTFNLADYAGTWTGFDNSGNSVTFTITADGTFKSTSAVNVSGRSATCTVNGSLVAATSGKNYATGTFTPGGVSDCPQQGGKTLQGVAVRLTDGSDTTQPPLLLVESVDSAQTVAWFSFARRQSN